MRIMRKSPQEVQCYKLDFPFWKWCNRSSFDVGGQRVRCLSHHKPQNQGVVFLWPSCFLSNAYSHVGCWLPKARCPLVCIMWRKKLKTERKKSRGNAPIGSMTLCEFVCLLWVMLFKFIVFRYFTALHVYLKFYFKECPWKAFVSIWGLTLVVPGICYVTFFLACQSCLLWRSMCPYFTFSPTVISVKWHHSHHNNHVCGFKVTVHAQAPL